MDNSIQEITKSILKEIEKQLQKKESLLIAIDGRCGSGKTTLSKELQKRCQCNVFHMDDFFLRKSQRTKERLKEPGGNVDYERFLKEVLLPLKNKKEFSYRFYNAHTWTFSEPILVLPLPINIIEGSYSCHPTLYPYYDLTIFLDVNKTEQISRIINRNGKEIAKVFKEKWIPLEEYYFSSYPIKEQCQLYFSLKATK